MVGAQWSSASGRKASRMRKASMMAVEKASTNLPKTASKTLMVGCLVSSLESKKVQ
jgi:hypothetical protein